MLDIDSFSFLNRALENDLAPLVVMASNRGMSKIRGTQYKSPHGLPADLLDRVLIVSTTKYQGEDIEQIIKIRCQEEDVSLTTQAIQVLTSMAQETSLRYALNLISAAQVVAKKRKIAVTGSTGEPVKAGEVGVDDLKRCYTYFLDERRSVQWVSEQQNTLISEEDNREPNSDSMQY